MTSDQDPPSRTTTDDPPANPTETDRTAVADGAGSATPGRAAARSPAAALGALVLSALSLVVAITGPLWSPMIYGSPGSAQFMVLGVAQLRPALETDGPFRNQLTLVRGVMPSQPDIDRAIETLAAYADKGVPTVPELQTSFVDCANAIMVQDMVGIQSGRFDRAVIAAAAALRLHALTHWLGGTWPASQIVWEAKTHLDTGDLAGASAALGKLNDPEGKVAEAWIRAAQSRIAANQVLELLETVARSQAGIPAQRS